MKKIYFCNLYFAIWKINCNFACVICKIVSCCNIQPFDAIENGRIVWILQSNQTKQTIFFNN